MRWDLIMVRRQLYTDTVPLSLFAVVIVTSAERHGAPIHRQLDCLINNLENQSSTFELRYIHWWSDAIYMMTSSNRNIFRVTGPLCGEFTGPGEFTTQRPVTRSFDVFFDLRLNKRLSKQPWGWWFERLSSSLWRHCNAHLGLGPLLLTWIHFNPSMDK